VAMASPAARTSRRPGSGTDSRRFMRTPGPRRRRPIGRPMGPDIRPRLPRAAGPAATPTGEPWLGGTWQCLRMPAWRTAPSPHLTRCGQCCAKGDASTRQSHPPHPPITHRSSKYRTCVCSWPARRDLCGIVCGTTEDGRAAGRPEGHPAADITSRGTDQLPELEMVKTRTTSRVSAVEGAVPPSW
jgi:hypothetical protein